MHRKLKYYLMFGAPIVVGGVLLGGGNVSAAGTDPSITLTKNTALSSDQIEVHPHADSPGTGLITSVYDLNASNIKSYAVYISTPSDTLLGENTGNTIPSMGSDTKSKVDDFDNNTWGYRAGLVEQNGSTSLSNNFTGAPVVDTGSISINHNTLGGVAYYLGGEITTTSQVINKRVVVQAATKIDARIVSDNYKGNLVVSAVATPASATIFNIDTMQEISKNGENYCENTLTPTPTANESTLTLTATADRKAEVENHQVIINGKVYTEIIPEVVLRDTRDDKSYIIRKLADGNCWMVQNLSLDSGTTEETRRVITDTDSDITKETLPESLSNMGEAGKYKLPVSRMEGFRDSDTDTGFMYNGSYQPYTYNTQGYADGQAKGDTNCSSYNEAGCNGANSGAYYNWRVAIAGSTDSITKFDNAPASICPKGWKLPSDHDSAGGSQFHTLYSTYGMDLDTFSKVWHGGDQENTSTSFVGNFYEDKLQFSGARAFWWSSTIGTDPQIYTLQLRPGEIYTVSGSLRVIGRSVRCVAR